MKRLTSNVDIFTDNPEDYFNNPKKIKRIIELQRGIKFEKDRLYDYEHVKPTRREIKVIYIKWRIDDLSKELQELFKH